MLIIYYIEDGVASQAQLSEYCLMFSFKLNGRGNQLFLSLNMHLIN